MRKVAESTIRRLSLYLRLLEEFEAQGIATVSSEALAGRVPANLSLPPLRRYKWIGENYFETMGIEMLQGRDFRGWDTGGLEYARNRADEFGRRAAEALLELPDGPGTDALQATVGYVVERRN